METFSKDFPPDLRSHMQKCRVDVPCSADVNQTRKEEQLLSHAIVFVQLESSCALISQILEKVHIVSACAIPPTCIPRISLLCTPVYPSGKLGGGVPAQVYAFG